MTPETHHWLRVSSALGPELLTSPWLRRLAGISFLGTLDRHPRSTRPSNRYQHALAVAALGLRAAEELELHASTRRALVAACLLHDVGHFPLSHAGERAFARRLGLDHHGMTKAIVLGLPPIPRAASLAPALDALGVDPLQVWTIIDGQGGATKLVALSELLRAPINLDTLDGIPRAAHTFALPHGRAVGERVERWASASSGESLPPGFFVWADDEIALAPQARSLADDFWRLKDKVYAEVIERPANVLAEARLVQAIEALPLDGVLHDLVHFDDESLRRLLRTEGLDVGLDPDDDERFTLRRRRTDTALAERGTKRYRVDTSSSEGTGALDPAAMRRRYRHAKEPSWLVRRDPHEQLSLPGIAQVGTERHTELPHVEAPDL